MTARTIEHAQAPTVPSSETHVEESLVYEGRTEFV